MENLFKLFDTEYKFMRIVWELEPVNSTDLLKKLLRRMGESNEKRLFVFKLGNGNGTFCFVWEHGRRRD